jgi:hypothetical protein
LTDVFRTTSRKSGLKKRAERPLPKEFHPLWKKFAANTKTLEKTMQEGFLIFFPFRSNRKNVYRVNTNNRKAMVKLSSSFQQFNIGDIKAGKAA